MSLIRTISGVQGTLGFQEVGLAEPATVVRPPGNMDSVERVSIAERMIRRYLRRFIFAVCLTLIFCDLLPAARVTVAPRIRAAE